METSLLQSRFARRLLLLFTGCALVPVGILAALALTHTSAQLERQARDRLQHASKSVGLAILERLEVLEAEARVLAERLERGAVDAAGHETALEHFEAMAVHEPGGSVRRLLGDAAPALPALDAQQRAQLEAGAPVLAARPGPDGAALLLVTPLAAGSPEWLVAVLDRDHVVGPAAVQTEGDGPEYCLLLEDGRPLACSLAAPPADLAAATAAATSGDVQWRFQGEPYLASWWSLFLKARFAAPSWQIVMMEPRARVVAPVATFKRYFVLVFAGAMLCVVLLATRWIRHSLVPLQRLRAGTRRIAAREFEARVDVTSGDEIEELATAFNGMAETLGRQFAEIQEWNRTLEARVEDRTARLSAALEELRETQARLVHREKMASVGQLVAGVAHELNNPLNFVQGNIPFLREHFGAFHKAIEEYEGLLRAGPDGGAQVPAVRERHDLDFVSDDLEPILEACQEGVQRAGAIVAGLQSFSRLDSSECREVDLREALEGTRTILTNRLTDLEVVAEYEEIPRVECLASQVDQVLMNLIVNAADAVGEAGRIVLRTAVPEPGWVRVEVEDDGCGIAPDVRDRIFDPFFTTKDVGQGTGLGLAITFGVVSRHSGRIEVESEPGQGSRFRVELPVKFTPPASDQPEGGPDEDRPEGASHP